MLAREQVFTGPIYRQRTSADDFNTSSILGLANLVLAITACRDGRIPNPGVMRGLDLLASPTPDMYLHLQPGAALTPNGLGILPNGLAILESVVDLHFDSNNDSNANPNQYPRLDLVSIGYGEQDVAQVQKVVIDPTSGATTQTGVAPQKVSFPVGGGGTALGSGNVVIITPTKGTPANPAVLPAVPSGELALYAVQVDYGATAITADKITPVTGTFPSAVTVLGSDTEVPNADVPWYSDELAMAVPAGKSLLLLGSLIAQPVPNPTLTVADFRPLESLKLEIEDAANTGVTLAFSMTPCWGSGYEESAVVSALVTAQVMLVVPGPVATVNYRLHAHPWLTPFPRSGAQWGAMNLYSWKLIGVLL